MAEKVKLASIGVGWWGSVLAEAAAASGQAEIVTCFARTPEKREAFAQKHQCRAAGSLDEILDDPQVDGVLIATSHGSHRPLAEAAAAAGKHIFVDKPLTLNVEDGVACLEAATSAGVVLQVGHQRRRSTANRRIKQMIDSGELGEIQALEANHSHPNGMRMPPEQWRWNTEHAPLGSITSLGIHKIDTMTYLAGPVRSVFTYTRSGPRIDQSTVLALEFESGVLGTLITSFFVPFVSRLAVFGSGGAAYNERDGAVLTFQKPDEAAPVDLGIEPNDPVVDQMAEFARAVRGEVEPETGGEAGVEVVAVLEAAVASSRSGTPEPVSRHRPAPREER